MIRAPRCRRQSDADMITAEQVDGGWSEFTLRSQPFIRQMMVTSHWRKLWYLCECEGFHQKV